MLTFVVVCYTCLNIVNIEKLLTPVPVRFRPEIKNRLTRVSRRFHLTPSEIIRRAVDSKLPEWERGNVMLVADNKGGEA